MAALSSFLPLVAPFVPGASDIAIRNAARNAAIDFCQRTLALQRTLASVNTVASQSDYTLVQSGEVVAKLMHVTLSGEPLVAVTESELDAEPSGTTAEAPRLALMAGPMKLRLYPTPTVADLPIVARAAMRPARAAASIDDDLFERYAQVIACGAAAWLASQAKKAYSNPNVAMEQRAMFNEGIAAAKVAVYNANARTRPRSRVRWC